MSTREALLVALLVALAGTAGAVLVLGGHRPAEGGARAFYQLVGGLGIGSADPDGAPVPAGEIFCPPPLFAGPGVWKAEARETQSKERAPDP